MLEYMYRLGIPCKFKIYIFFPFKQYKWRWGNCMITIMKWVEGKPLAGNTGPSWTVMSPKCLYILKRLLFPWQRETVCFCCSRHEHVKVFSYHILISLCCLGLIKGFFPFWKWRQNSERALTTATASPGSPFSRKSNCAYLHPGSARWSPRRVSLYPSWDGWENVCVGSLPGLWSQRKSTAFCSCSCCAVQWAALLLLHGHSDASGGTVLRWVYQTLLCCLFFDR